MSLIDKWGNFLSGHKLTPQRAEPMVLVKLCELLAATGQAPKWDYKERLQCRRLVCLTAMENGIDLGGMRHQGKLAMARGLLDVWNQVYQEKYGSNYGTTGQKEASRRDAKIRTHLKS